MELRTSQQSPIRVKLRRQYNEHELLIEQNLKNLEVKSFSKKYAQQQYYRVNDNMNQSNRIPVHARLGRKKINLRRGAYHFLNNGYINKNLPPRRRMMKRSGISQNLQNRLRFRHNGPQRLHLNRTPRDYTIQIKNSLQASDNRMAFRHSCMAQLSLQLQSEITLIQTEAENKTLHIIPSQPIHVQGYGVTNVSLHQRFSV